MRRTVSPKLAGYVALVAGGLLGGLALRRPGLVGLVAPFALWLAVGLATVREPEPEVSATADRDRAVEGEEVEVAVRVAAATTIERLELWLRVHPNLEPVGEASSRVLRVAAGTATTVRFRLRCGRWGAYRLGEIQVRCHDRFGLLAFDQEWAAALPLKVYPSPQVLRALLRPTHAQRLVGDQRTRLAGDGVEFAEIRPLLPGDPIRHVNWRASGRRGELHVNRHHPERNTDVVLFLDIFAETGDERGSTLDLAVRAAASLAGRYLAVKDRVGLVGFGGYLTWLYPSGGRSQLWRILDVLLDTRVVTSYADKTVQIVPVRMLPPGAIVIGVTPLLDERGIRALLDLRRRGFEVAILAISPAALARPSAGETGELAWRLWQLERDALRIRYQRLGVAVAEWRPEEPLEIPIGEVRRFQRRLRHARA
jgi:uncharacterized protein (DUF58 family)